VHLGSLFTGNKPSRVVHLECELHNLVQGDMLAHDYNHQLQQLANSLVDCDAPIFDHALVHQLIRGLNPKFSILKTLLPLLPRFATFIKASDLILHDETSQDVESKRGVETTLLTTGAAAAKTDTTPPAQPTPNGVTNNNANNNFYVGGHGRSGGRGRGGGRGHGGHNGGCGGGGRNANSNNAPFWAPSSPWAPSWGVPWCAPWTGVTGPGLLDHHPPTMPAQAYQAS
jgi:uncharacterized membrane protein YgcG